MGFVQVANYTSEAEMKVAYSAIQSRLMNPPKRKAIPPCPDLEFIEVEYSAPEQDRVEMQHDAHVNARACYMLHNLSGRAMAMPIIKKMCKFYGVTYHDICSARRANAITFPRQKMVWVVRHRTKFSFPEIGRKFGGRDHTTVLHAVRKIDALIAANDPSVSEMGGWLDGSLLAEGRI